MNAALKRRQARLKRQVRVRRKVRGTSDMPRLCVFRSAKHVYAQIVEDTTGKTLVSASTVNADVAEGLKYTGNVDAAKAVGKAIAQKALAMNIKNVVFDRNGFLYHGRVKTLAEAAREAGLSF
ncbi:MAG: 50S ribosomal protein L18 [Syntrophotalea acetylenica]|uniref:50S ribosomal protein L18 n=1 Tax=Syntrophotalea TaxID=2812025 RepID=UPI000930A565|nr:50S ribosomal protein L18 [Syntrophotalea acetylenica]MDD4456224.1 50S ribosomal protein L18 [Syntrophotalea acetylenica]MDY0261861.1 50S ribosomal protein L18 [Syntrophotalea acetylenica]